MFPPPRVRDNVTTNEDVEGTIPATTVDRLIDTIQGGTLAREEEKFNVQDVVTPEPTLIPPLSLVLLAIKVGDVPQLVTVGVPDKLTAVPSVFDNCLPEISPCVKK